MKTGAQSATPATRVRVALEMATVGHGRFSSWTGPNGGGSIAYITLDDLRATLDQLDAFAGLLAEANEYLADETDPDTGGNVNIPPLRRRIKLALEGVLKPAVLPVDITGGVAG